MLWQKIVYLLTYLSLLPGYYTLCYRRLLHTQLWLCATHITVLQLYTFNVKCMPQHLHFWAGGARPFGASAVSRLIWVPGPQHGSRYTCSMWRSGHESTSAPPGGECCEVGTVVRGTVSVTLLNSCVVLSEPMFEGASLTRALRLPNRKVLSMGWIHWTLIMTVLFIILHVTCNGVLESCFTYV